MLLPHVTVMAGRLDILISGGLFDEFFKPVDVVLAVGVNEKMNLIQKATVAYEVAL